MTSQLEAGGDTGNNEDGGSLIFVSDASAEAERLTTALRGRGYPVIDVPLGLLVSRVAVQRPSLILCDADAPAAVETIQRVRELPGGNRIDVLFLGEPGRAVDKHAGALQQEASGVFVRPVDDFILLRKVEALIGAPSGRLDFNARMSPVNRAPVLVAATRRPYRYEANKSARETPSYPAASAAALPLATSPGTEAEASGPRRLEQELETHPRSSRPGAPHSSRAELPQSRLSPGLESLLATAERRVRAIRNSSIPPVDRLSPEAELEAILPADVLDALDEPLDFEDEDDDPDSAVGTNNGSDGDPGSRSGSKTTGGGAATSSGIASAGRSDAGLPVNEARERTASAASGSGDSASNRKDPIPPRVTEPPLTPPQHAARMPSEGPGGAPMEESILSRPTNAGATSHDATDPPPSVVPASDAAARMSTAPPGVRRFGAGADPKFSTIAQPSAMREPQLEIPASVAAGDAVRAFARVVRARYTGALAFEDTTGIRRVLFRDGDFVTAASGAEGESLVAFLTQRGDLASDVAARIGRKLPQFGRHAGAALIAQGHLRQDDLWPVLRAHAEWLVGRIVRMQSGGVGLEADVPLRMQAEPAVFGGATGAEVLLEIVRRAVPPEEALQRLGGATAVLQRGETPALLGECAMSDAEAEIVRSITEEPVNDAVRRAGDKDFTSALYVLVELSVLGLSSAEKRRAPDAKPKPGQSDPLDHAALRARILARKALTEEGDYFALLGVARSATSYDIRRAYATLKDEYDPARILTRETLDLRDEVELISEVLSEAVEILEDDLRRERYRRALDANP